jgi:hypothetical protein
MVLRPKPVLALDASARKDPLLALTCFLIFSNKLAHPIIASIIV